MQVIARRDGLRASLMRGAGCIWVRELYLRKRSGMRGVMIVLSWMKVVADVRGLCRIIPPSARHILWCSTLGLYESGERSRRVNQHTFPEQRGQAGRPLELQRISLISVISGWPSLSVYGLHQLHTPEIPTPQVSNQERSNNVRVVMMVLGIRSLQLSLITSWCRKRLSHAYVQLTALSTHGFHREMRMTSLSCRSSN